MPSRLFSACLLACLALPSAAQVSLSPATEEVRCAYGRVVTLESRGRLARLRTLDGLGHVIGTLDLGESLPGARAMEVEDFTPGPDGRIVASIAVAYPLGASARLVIEFGPGDERRVFPLDSIACHRIAQLPDGAIWCLGPGPSGDLLHRIDTAADTVRSLLDAGTLPLLHNPGADARETWAGGAAGLPQLLAAGRSLVAWLPNAGAIVAVDPAGARTRSLPLPVRTATRSLISVASCEDGLFALLPESTGTGEHLQSRYVLFRHDPTSERWLLLSGAGSWPRGSRLAGCDGAAIAIWIRAGNLLQWQSAWRLAR